MINKDSIFDLFGQPEKNQEGNEILTLSNKILDEPYTKIGMFTKLIINHHVFHEKLKKFIRSENPNFSVEETKRASEFTVYNRAWHYIKQINLTDPNHLEAIYEFTTIPFIKSLDDAIKYFSNEEVEEYEKCAKLLEIKTLKKNLENPLEV